VRPERVKSDPISWLLHDDDDDDDDDLERMWKEAVVA
jgi:hypothetical protein